MMGYNAIALMMAGGFAITTLSALVGAIVVQPPRGWQDLPWWERARVAYPARVGPAVATFVVSVILSWTLIVYFTIIGFRPSVGWLIITHLTGILGAVCVAMLAAWRVAPRRRPLWYWLAGCATAVLFGFPNTIVYVAIAISLLMLPHDMQTVIGVLLVAGAGMGFAAWGGGIWVARVLGLARPALPRAAHAADWAAERVGARASAVFELTWPRVTVDAFVFSRYLIVTDSAAQLLSDEELFALAIREITFFKQRWLAGTLRVIDSAVIYFMLCCTAIGATLGGNAILVGTLIGFSVSYLIRPFAKRAQLKADALAAQSAIEPAAALRALERQFELNLTPVVAISDRSRDAHLYDRMIASGIQPAYPRPQRPSKGKILLSVAAASATCVVLSIIFLTAVAAITR